MVDDQLVFLPQNGRRDIPREVDFLPLCAIEVPVISYKGLFQAWRNTTMGRIKASKCSKQYISFVCDTQHPLFATSPAVLTATKVAQTACVQVSQSTPPLCGSDPLSTMETWQHGSHSSHGYQHHHHQYHHDHHVPFCNGSWSSLQWWCLFSDSQVVTTILYPIYIGIVNGHGKSKGRIRKYPEKSKA